STSSPRGSAVPRRLCPCRQTVLVARSGGEAAGGAPSYTRAGLRGATGLWTSSDPRANQLVARQRSCRRGCCASDFAECADVRVGSMPVCEELAVRRARGCTVTRHKLGSRQAEERERSSRRVRERTLEFHSGFRRPMQREQNFAE